MVCLPVMKLMLERAAIEAEVSGLVQETLRLADSYLAADARATYNRGKSMPTCCTPERSGKLADCQTLKAGVAEVLWSMLLTHLQSPCCTCTFLEM